MFISNVYLWAAHRHKMFKKIWIAITSSRRKMKNQSVSKTKFYIADAEFGLVEM